MNGVRGFRAMKIDTGELLKIVLASTAMVVWLLAVPGSWAWAAVNCGAPVAGADADGDGLTDTEECLGITLPGGANYPKCVSSALRVTCLDPDTKDLFAILVRSVPSNIPMNPFEHVSRPVSSGGLGITVHEISAAQANADRSITATQKAVRITENLDTAGDIFGIANVSTPNGLDFSTVFTRRIIDFIDGVYNGAGDTATNRTPVKDAYIKHTLNHEVGHLITLTTDYNSRFGGNHYKAGSTVIMEQSVVYSVRRGTVTFTISTDFTAADVSGAALR
jgi:hypothetical protein